MKMIKLKKTALIFGLTAFVATSAIGCGNKESYTGDMNPDEVVIEAGDEAVKLSQAYFLIKWQQANYQNIMTVYGYGDDWYEQDIFGTGEGYQDYFKRYYKDILTRICLARSVMNEYGVEITEEEQAEIDQAAEGFAKANVKSAQNAMMADEEVVRQVLKDYKILEKVAVAMTDDIDMVISEEEYKEEAYTRTYDYVYVSFETTDEEGNRSLLTASQQEDLFNQLSAIRTETLETGNFETAAANAGQQVSSHTYKPSAKAGEDTLEDINHLMDDCEIGDVTEVIPLDTTGAIIAYLSEDNTNELNSEETRSAAEETILLERRQALFEKKMKELKSKTNINVNDKLWDQITMEEPLAALTSNSN